MRKKESIFKDRVMKDLKTLTDVWVLKTQERTRRGVPDLLICMRGRFVAIELKKDDKSHLDPLQGAVLNLISRSGGWAFATSPEVWSGQFQLLRDRYQAEREPSQRAAAG